MIASNNTREDLERDITRFQQENWEYKRVGCSNTDHISLFNKLEKSNNENDTLKQERNTLYQNVNLINENVEKVLLENISYNKKIDLLVKVNENVEKLLLENLSNNNKIDLLVKVIDSLNTKVENLNSIIENLNKQNKKNNDNYNNKIGFLSEKIKSIEKVNDSLSTNTEKLYQENKKNIDHFNTKIDMLSVNIKSLEAVNQSLNQQQSTLEEQQNNSLVEIMSFTKSNESLHQQLNSWESKLNEQNLGINERISKSCKVMELCIQDLSFLKTSSFFKILDDWIDENKKTYFEFLYKASEEDFSTSAFHSSCDGKGATITLIETTTGDVFGGYNSQSWNSNDIYYGDNKCFIFTLVNKHGIKPTKYFPGTDDKCIVGSRMNSGPLFGKGLDIGVVGSKEGSYQSFPTTYIDTTGMGKLTLTPSLFFIIKTIEIYKCV
ncbi:hypothetical protein CYY_007252 [Polysphondylium violaceum]|uniref:TLDc domain-containing protein n=1 Tax=Polysphondylium violaceum TaxID=133409 RepID=A0A8J4UY47_9MYCE|nr:hypothetical protein CYY_007252 [Polysphondylium violaceum]